MEEKLKREVFEKCMADSEYCEEVKNNPVLFPTYRDILMEESEKRGISIEEMEKKMKLDLLKEIQRELSKEIVGEEKTIRALTFICMSIFLVNKKNTSFHTVINSESGSGKDFILDKFGKLFHQASIKYSRISSKALDYKGTSKVDKAQEFTWNGKILILTDINNEILNNDTLKVFLSDGSKTAIVQDGYLKEREIDGIPVVLMSSYKCDPEHELLRRVNLINLDESKEQTRRIMKFEKKEEINYQRLNKMLETFNDYVVVIPFKNEIIEKLSEHIHMRTYFNKIMDFIKVATTINQKRRDVNKNNELVAIKQDYLLAKEVLENMSYGTNFIPIPIAEKKRLNRLIEFFNDKWFTLTEVTNEFGLAKSTICEHLSKLEEDGYLEKVRMMDQYDNCRIKYHVISDSTNKPKLPDI
jgi:DNA-binding transcriptional ArsR family regulator